MFAKWKSKLKAAIKEAKDKRKEKQNKHSSRDAILQPVGAIDKQSDGLSRPYGLGGRRSIDASVPTQGSLGQSGSANNSTAAAAGGVQQPHSDTHPAGQQHMHAAGHVEVSAQQRQLDQQHANKMVQHQQHQHEQQQQHMHGHVAGLRPVDCADRNTHGVEMLMQSCPGSPSTHASPTPGALQDNFAPAGQASTVAASTATVSTYQAEGGNPAGGGHASTAAAGDNTEHGSTLGATGMHQHRLDASRTPRDEELGTCPPYAAKAVWGLRYTMEDKWAAVPNLVQLPIVLTSSSKKSKASKASGCGCMIPAASKVLSKVSPSSRLGSSSSGGKDAKTAAAAQGANPGLEKPSPDRQRLIGQGISSSDEQGLLESASGSEGTGPLPGMDALHYFGVFDGHGGADAARHCAQRMHQTVCSTILSMLSPELAAAAVVSTLATSSKHSAPESTQEQQQQDEQLAASAAAAANDTGSSSSSSTAAPAAAQPMPAIDIAASNGSWLLPALSRAFVSLDHEFGAISEGSYVGTTAVVVLIGGSRMWVAHAGDSRAVLGRGGAVQVLTSDHKASRDDEVARVQAAGGHVWWDRVMGELAVSRAIGDHCLRPYVIPEPELLMVERTPEDEVLVMASDGLWDVMNNQEAADMAVHSLQAAHASGHTGVAAVKRSANALTKAALERGTRDNVTVLVIDLRPRKPGTYEAVMAASSTHHTSRHSTSTGSRGHSSRSSKKAAAAAAAAMAAAPATAAAAGVASSHSKGSGTPSSAATAAESAQEVPHSAVVAAGDVSPASAVVAAPAASVTAQSSAAAPAAAAAAAAHSVGAVPAAAPAADAAAVAAASPAGGVQVAGHTSSADETNMLMQPHAVGSSHGAGI